MASYTSKCTTKIIAAIASAALVLGLMPSMALAAVETQETQGTQGEPVANAAPAAVVDDAAQGEDGEGENGPEAQLMTVQSEEPDGEPRITTMSTDEYTENGIKYALNTDTRTALVIGSVDDIAGAVTIPAAISYGGTDYDVTAIWDSAFDRRPYLMSVTIPEGVTSIGHGAFKSCTGLTSVTIPGGVTSIGREAFFACAFSSVTIPEGVTSIGDFAFGMCGNLTSLTIPASVESVEGSAFRVCQSLQKVTILSGKTTFGENAFAECPVTDVYYGGTADDWSEVAGKFPNDVKVHYIVTATADPEAGGTVKGADTYLADAQVTLTATPATGYHFASWTEGGTTVSTDAVYKFSATGSRTLVANFELDKCKVSFVDEDSTVLQSGEVEYGKTPAYTGKTPTKAADEKCTYEFTGWTPEIVAATGDATYKATYKAVEKYPCAEGSGQTWAKGSTDPLTLRFKGAADDKATFDLFKGVEVDGKTVPEKDSSGNANWTASKGSLILSLQPSYLEALGDGNHTVKALFDDGAGETSFTIAAKATPAADTTRPASSSNTAKTGDTLPVTPVIATLLLSVCALVISKRKLQVVHPAYRGKHVR